MNKNTISFLKGNYGNKTIELEEKFSSVNVVLEDILNDLISKAQNLQVNKNYNEVINVVEIQKSINNLMSTNSTVIKGLRVDDKQEKEVEVKTPALLDYDEYLVDTNIPHNLQEDFRHKRPYAFDINGHYVKISTWKEMLVATCQYLYGLNPEIFNSFVDDESMHWGKTYNFSLDKKQLRTGTLIKGSKVYVETSKDSIAVRQLVIKMLEKYNLSAEVYKVYLRADYTERHIDGHSK